MVLREILDAPLDEAQYTLARLPVRRGGLGILDTVVASAPALTVLAQSSPAHVVALRALIRPGHLITADLAQRELFETWTEQHLWTDALNECSSTLLETTLPASVGLLGCSCRDHGALVQLGATFRPPVGGLRALKTGEALREVTADVWVVKAHALARAVARQLARARQAA